MVGMVIFKDFTQAEHASNAITDLGHKFTDSRKNNLIQLADMVVGAVARSYSDNRKDANRWLNVLKSRDKIKSIGDFK